MNNKIVVLDGYVANSGDLSWEPLEKLGDLTVYERTAPSEVIERLEGATAAITNKVVISREIIEALPQLKYIGELATGYDNVDIVAAREHGIPVCNVPSYSSEHVAQTVFALLLHIVSRVADYTKAVRDGQWQYCCDFSFRLNSIEQLSGSTMGVYGLGAIGHRVAEIAHAFGMNVCALTSKSSAELPDYIQKVDRDQFFRISDVISLNAPLTAENRNFINSATLSMMKPDAILINTARGGLVDENALYEALSEHKIFAAGLDVLTVEPPKNGNKLFELDNCFVTPHIAWQSTQARRKLLEVTIDNYRCFLEGKLQNVVNK